MREIGHFINGKEVKGNSGRFGDVFNPNTGEVQAKVSFAKHAEVEHAIAVAAAAQPAWAAMPHTQRAAILRKAGDIWLANAAEIEEWSVREGGKIPPAAL